MAASKHTQVRVQWSNTSVGLAQGRPKDYLHFLFLQ